MSTPPVTARVPNASRRSPSTWWRDEIGVSPAPLVVTWLIVAAALCAGGLLLTHALAGSSIVHADLHAERWLAAHRTGALDRLTGAGTFIADTVTVAVLWPLAMLVAWRLTRVLVAPLFILLTVGVEKLTYLGTSMVVGRPRPPVHPVGHSYATKSFPSGHVASSITLYGAIAALLCAYGAARAWRRVAIGFTCCAPFVVAFSRMYRGFHYPTDVIAGALLGAVWLAATVHLLLRPATTPTTPTTTREANGARGGHT